MTNDTPTLQLAVWDDPLAANGLQTDTDDALDLSSAVPRPDLEPRVASFVSMLDDGHWSCLVDRGSRRHVRCRRVADARLARPLGTVRDDPHCRRPDRGPHPRPGTRRPPRRADARLPRRDLSLSGRPRRRARGMTAPSARQVTVCASAKGGQGCTTIAAVLAVLAAQSNQPTLLLDTRGDAAPTLGVSDPAPASTFAEAIANAVEPCAPSTRRLRCRRPDRHRRDQRARVSWSRQGIG